MSKEGLGSTDVAVISAHNEEASIGLVVKYLRDCGFGGRQILLVDSHCSDKTVQAALEAAGQHPDGAGMRVVYQEKMLGKYAAKLDEYGVTVSGSGKGGAMYSATLALSEENHPPTSRVYFLDGDLTNPETVDPIGHLLSAWAQNSCARIAKLASEKRENEGTLAFLNTLPWPWNQISNLAWPLCGQQSLHLGDLQDLPFAADYSIEMALLAVLVEKFGSECLSQYPTSVHLDEEKHPDDLQRYTRMFSRIALFMQAVVKNGGLAQMRCVGAFRRWNLADWREVSDIGVPTTNPGSSNRESLTIDSLLPPIKQLLV